MVISFDIGILLQFTGLGFGENYRYKWTIGAIKALATIRRETMFVCDNSRILKKQSKEYYVRRNIFQLLLTFHFRKQRISS